MRKINRLHVAAALLMIVSVVSLLGISLAAGTSTSALTVVKIHSTQLVEKCVFWDEAPGITSGYYASWGRTYMHILMYVKALPGEEIELRVLARTWNKDKSGYWDQIVYQGLKCGRGAQIWTLNVPSREFRFRVLGPSDTKINLNFYLSGS